MSSPLKGQIDAPGRGLGAEGVGSQETLSSQRPAVDKVDDSLSWPLLGSWLLRDSPFCPEVGSACRTPALQGAVGSVD